VIADRFAQDAGGWLDLATGARIRLRVIEGGTRAAQVAWSAQCEVLATLRHPAAAPLLDFGAIGDRLFEAYATGPAPASSAKRSESVLAHAAQFLRHHRILLTGPQAEYLLRPRVIGGRDPRGRPLGIVLQRRPALDAIADALEGAAPTGPCVIRVVGPPHSGLRTLRTFAARAARLHGYVPICAHVITTRPELHGQLLERHVCVLAGDGEGGAALAGFLARLSDRGGRRHMVLHLGRDADPQRRRAIRMDAMGVDAMTAMVFVGGDFAPARDELLDAARDSGGRPGLFLARLCAMSYDARPALTIAVHETAPTYAPCIDVAAIAPRRRLGSVLLRAAARADELAGRGRHAGARRLLLRACHILAERGARARASECARALAGLALDRGQPEAALRHFDRARALSPDGAASVLTSIGIGDAWLWQGRLIEAEGAHRGAVVAARAAGDAAAGARAANALATSLYWQGRCDEAAIAIEEALVAAIPCEVRSVLLSTRARIHLAERAIAPAVRAGRRALALASEGGSARASIAAHEALAAALASAGDHEPSATHARRGLSLARRAHLPLDAARLRITALDIAAATDDCARIEAIAARVSAASTRLPRLLRFCARAAVARARRRELDPETREFIRASGARAIGLGLPSGGPSQEIGELQVLLEMAYQAADDRSGLIDQCAELAAKLRAVTVAVMAAAPPGRLVALTGRPWTAEPAVMTRAVASGLPVSPLDGVEPCEAAAPVRYGSETIAAIGCRWSAGTPIDAARASAILRVGALAVAPGVRALLDRAIAPEGRTAPEDLLGDSPAACALRQAAVCAARAPFPVLVEGESGSGKELVARAIHRLGPRRERRLCAVNCAALSDDLLESELFGHARGAFTGAVADRGGLFEEADGGTLFLDEVGELSPRAQAKLLRVLQDGELRRVGETLPRRVDVRVIAATNRRLEQEVAAGRFRADLRFRLDVIRIEVPPLRDHATDIPLLAARFWADAAARVSCRATLSPEALAALARYDWPGNVRELQNAMAWIAVHAPRRGRIGPAALPAHIAHAGQKPAVTFEVAREEFERRFVKVALASAHGRRGRAAEALGVTRQGLSKMLRRLGIDENAVEGD